MLPSTMSNSTSLSEEANSVSSVTTGVQDFGSLNSIFQPISSRQQQKIKKKRSLPGNPDPDAEVIALSPKDLMATNRFVCEICKKGFQRDQNLQLHRRGHNLPWKLRQRTSTDIRKRVYVCPEPSCVHHHPSRALGDLTGIKKHFSRKHGEKKWKCEKCSKRYAVQSDWKAHSKTCGTREYRCDCGTIFARKDSFITHRAFCDALAEESARLSTTTIPPFTNSSDLKPHNLLNLHSQHPPASLFSVLQEQQPPHISLPTTNPTPTLDHKAFHQNPHIHPFSFEEPPKKQPNIISPIPSLLQQEDHNNVSSHMYSATSLLQKAASIGATVITSAPEYSHSVGHYLSSSMSQLEMVGELVKVPNHMGTYMGFNSENVASLQKSDGPTRDFLGLAASGGGNIGGGGGRVNVNVRDMLSFNGALDFPMYDHGHDSLMLRHQGFGFTESAAETWGDC